MGTVRAWNSISWSGPSLACLLASCCPRSCRKTEETAEQRVQVHERSEGDSFNGLYGYHDQMAAPVFLDQVIGYSLLPS